MTVSMQDVRALLDPEEPDYGAVAGLGPDSLPHLRSLVQSDDVMLASKAAYAASVLASDSGLDVIETAARHDDPILRAAAAAASRNLPKRSARRVLLDLVTDADPGVRKIARSSAPDDATGELAERMAEEEPEPAGDDPVDLSSLGGLMPGEQPPSGMPGESRGLMPGERP